MLIKIIEPFWGAGSIYGWGHEVPGIGLNNKKVLEAKKNGAKIHILIGNNTQEYQISPITVLNLAKKYKSLRTVRYGVKVLVIPQNAFEKVPEYVIGEDGIAREV